MFESQRCGPQNSGCGEGGKRTSLTAPEGKLVCDAYGIPVPKEGVATSAAEAAKSRRTWAFRS